MRNKNMMKDVKFSCIQEVMISSELFLLLAEDIFWREIFFGSKMHDQVLTALLPEAFLVVALACLVGIC